MESAAPRSVLVIDDEPSVATSIRRVLELGGHRVECVLDGKRALEVLRTAKFDVIITDVFMPDCDGIEIVLAAHRLHPTAQLIAMSGGGSYMTMGDALKVSHALGATDTLHKPFTASQLLSCIDGSAARGT